MQRRRQTCNVDTCQVPWLACKTLASRRWTATLACSWDTDKASRQAIHPHIQTSLHPTIHDLHPNTPKHVYLLLQERNEHAKGSAPVAHVVNPLYAMSNVFQQPSDRVTDDGGTKMTHVHFYQRYQELSSVITGWHTSVPLAMLGDERSTITSSGVVGGGKGPLRTSYVCGSEPMRPKGGSPARAAPRPRQGHAKGTTRANPPHTQTYLCHLDLQKGVLHEDVDKPRSGHLALNRRR